MGMRALYIGIDEYPHRRQRLVHCAENAKDIAAVLGTTQTEGIGGQVFDAPNWPTGRGTTLNTTDDGPIGQTRAREAIERLCAGGAGDDILFYYAGHAVAIDSTGAPTDDTANATDLLLNTSDDDPSGGRRRGIRLSTLIDACERNHTRSATILLDCCNGGVIATMHIADNMAVLAATNTLGPAADGQFSDLLLTGLEGGAADIRGNVSTLSLYMYARELLDMQTDGQEPLFKACISSRPVTLRRVPTNTHPVTGDDVAHIPELFASADGACRLYPEMEGPRAREGEYRDGRETSFTDDQLLMNYFRRMRDSQLAEFFVPDGRGGEAPRQLFDACMYERDHPGVFGFARLTKRGQYLWNVAARR